MLTMKVNEEKRWDRIKNVSVFTPGKYYSKLRGVEVGGGKYFTIQKEEE